MKIILASASPRRAEILRQAGIQFEVAAGDVSEETDRADPEELVQILSKRKADAAAAESTGEDAVILAADTVVAAGGEILGKPADREEAKRMLMLLSGGSHFVYTGVTIFIRQGSTIYEETFAEKTKVWVSAMTEEQINRYIDTGEPMDKAGAYAVQGRFAVYIRKISGDFYTIVGFPIAEICQRMQRAGYDLLCMNNE